MGTRDYPPPSADCPRGLISAGLDYTTGVTHLVLIVGLGKPGGRSEKMRSLGLPRVSEQSRGVRVDRE